MKIQKKICLLLAVAMSVSTFSGCTKQKGAKKGEPVTVQWNYPGDNQPDIGIVEDEINKITVKSANVKLKFAPIDEGAYDQKMNMMMAANTEFDICFSGYVNTYERGIKMGGFEQLNDYIDAHPKLKESLPDYAWKAVDIGDDEIYAVPCLQIYALTQCFAMLKEYTDKYNVDLSKIKTIEDIEPTFEKIRDNEKDVYPFNSVNAMSIWFGGKTETIAPNIYIYRDDDSAKLYKDYEMPEFKKSIDKIHEYYQRGFIRKDVASAGAISDSSSKPYFLTTDCDKPGILEDLKVLKGKDYVAVHDSGPYLSSSMVTQTLNAISATSKHVDSCMDLLEQVYTDNDLFRLMLHGIEGKHYEKLDDIHIRTINTDKYNLHTRGWMFANQFNDFLLEGKAADTWKKTQEINDKSRRSPLLGFLFDSSNVSNEVAAVSAVKEEYSGLFNGTVDPSKFNEYVKKMDAAGIDKIFAEAQKQVNEFLKK